MRRLPLFLLTACILSSISFNSCQKEFEGPAGPGVVSGTGLTLSPTPVQASVQGVVVDENNIAVAGAIVKSGTNTTTTDSRGLFLFTNIQLDKYASIIIVDKNGYFKGIRTFSPVQASANFVKLQLIPKSLSGTINATAGGSVTLADNSKITLNPNSIIVKSTGQAYTGDVKVFAANIDPTVTNIAQIVPGSFQAIDINNYRVTLKSYGMMAVELEGQSGESLQIATGQTAKLRVTIPSSLLVSAPASMPLWSLNETSGLWKQEGNGLKTGTYYEGDVSHFSFWNCDIGINSIYLELTVHTAEGALPHSLVKITRVNNGGSSNGYTDSAGHVGGLVFSNEPLLLEILNTCHQPIYSQAIGPFSQNTNLGIITVTIPAQHILHITGTAVNCTNQPVTNGYALIYFEGHLYTRPVHNGSFSTAITRCSTTSVSIEVIVVDNAVNQQSAPWTGVASTGTANTGIISACGTSSLQFINYTVDGTNFILSSANPGDSLRVYGNSGTNIFTNISGFRIGQANFKINLGINGSAVGTFPLQYLTVNQYDSIVPVVPFNLNFTTYGAPGQFIEGNFTGQFRELSNSNVHTLSATFKVRRHY